MTKYVYEFLETTLYLLKVKIKYSSKFDLYLTKNNFIQFNPFIKTKQTMQQRMEDIAEMCLSEDELNLAMMQLKNLEHPPMGADALRMSLCLHSLNVCC